MCYFGSLYMKNLKTGVKGGTDREGYRRLTAYKSQPGGCPCSSPRAGLDVLHFVNSVLSLTVL